jgi:hypothetical protein
MRGVLAAAFFGAEAFIPLMLVQERGLRPGTAGLVLTGAALGWATGSWYQGRPNNRCPATCWCRPAACSSWSPSRPRPRRCCPRCPVGWSRPGASSAASAWASPCRAVSVLVSSSRRWPERGANSAGLQLADALLSTISIGVGGRDLRARPSRRGAGRAGLRHDLRGDAADRRGRASCWLPGSAPLSRQGRCRLSRATRASTPAPGAGRLPSGRHVGPPAG